MLFRVNPQSGVPVYLQLIEQVRHAVEVGALRPDDQLPAIRTVAEDLVINVNTVAKAYREMEHAGLVVLRQGTGAFVARHREGGAPAQQAVRKARGVVQRAVAALRELGLEDGAIRRLVDSELAAGVEEARK
jgi:GntR family transcriptional regulator